MEYSNNDYAIATVAKALEDSANNQGYTVKTSSWDKVWYPNMGDSLNLNDIYKLYKKKASSWEKLWNTNIKNRGFDGFIWPRLSNGAWIDTSKFNVFSTGSLEAPFYETFSWEYSFYAPHDMKRLIEKCGGRETFSKRLDAYFTEPYGGDRGNMQLFVTFIGMCQISNEPAFLVPSLYSYVNKPYQTAKIVRQILATQYNSTHSGVPGNDDSGSMGAWYAFHALGFYPNTGQDVYLISSPIFPRSTITLENGKQVVITAKNASEKNIYIQSCKLNGKSYNNCWFRHGDIADGAIFEFVMGDKPSDWATNGELPPSMSDEK